MRYTKDDMRSAIDELVAVCFCLAEMRVNRDTGNGVQYSDSDHQSAEQQLVEAKAHVMSLLDYMMDGREKWKRQVYPLLPQR